MAASIASASPTARAPSRFAARASRFVGSTSGSRKERGLMPPSRGRPVPKTDICFPEATISRNYLLAGSMHLVLATPPPRGCHLDCSRAIPAAGVPSRSSDLPSASPRHCPLLAPLTRRRLPRAHRIAQAGHPGQSARPVPSGVPPGADLPPFGPSSDVSGRVVPGARAGPRPQTPSRQTPLVPLLSWRIRPGWRRGPTR